MAKLLLPVEVAAMMRVSLSTFERMLRAEADFPKAIIIGRRKRFWKSEDVESWLAVR